MYQSILYALNKKFNRKNISISNFNIKNSSIAGENYLNKKNNMRLIESKIKLLFHNNIIQQNIINIFFEKRRIV